MAERPSPTKPEKTKTREFTPDQLAVAVPITPEVVAKLKRFDEAVKGPVRDDLTNRYNFRPTANGAKEYIRSGVNKALGKRKAAGAEAVRQLVRDRKKSQWAAVTEVQRTCSQNGTLSRFRWYHLGMVQEALSFGETPPLESAKWAADAVEDYGASLYSLKLPHKAEGAGLIVLGRAMAEDSGLLAGQEELLGIVAHEQSKRYVFWSEHGEAMQEAFGDKLSGIERQNAQEVEALFKTPEN